MFHVGTIAAMAMVGVEAGLPPVYFGGVVVVAALLVYEQSLVAHDDLSQVKRAFDLNGYVGLVYFAATALALYAG
jgi:4-hydroxybenzoate polyprenyltransferase